MVIICRGVEVAVMSWPLTDDDDEEDDEDEDEDEDLLLFAGGVSVRPLGDSDLDDEADDVDWSTCWFDDEDDDDEDDEDDDDDDEEEDEDGEIGNVAWNWVDEWWWLPTSRLVFVLPVR